MKKRILSLLLAVITVLHLCPLTLLPAVAESGQITMEAGKLYTAEFAVSEFKPYARYHFEEVSPYISELPMTLTVVRESELDFNYVYVTDKTQNWPETYAEYRYVNANDIIITSAKGVETALEDMEIGVEYYGMWRNTSEGAWVITAKKITDAEADMLEYGDYPVPTAGFPSELKVQLVFADELFVYATNDDWPAEYERYRYVDLADITVTGVYLDAQLGSFTASVKGATIPSGANLELSEIAESDYDANAYEYYDPLKMGDLLGAYDIQIKNSDSTEWQPGSGETVTVTMNTDTWALIPSGFVYIIHVHTGVLGIKSYEVIGPVAVSAGHITFELSGFSPVYVVEGQESTTPADGDIYYLTPGSSVVLQTDSVAEVTYTGTLTYSDFFEDIVPKETTNGCGDTSYTYTITVSSEALSDETSHPFNVKWGDNNYTVHVKIVNAQIAFVGAHKAYPLQIAILDLDDAIGFPAEPSNTVGQYLTIRSTTETLGTGETVYQTSGALNSASGITFNEDASNCLDPAKLSTSPYWTESPTGENIAGIVDPTGLNSKSIFKEGAVDWVMLARTIAYFNAPSYDPNVTYTLEGEGQLETIGDPVSIRYEQEINGTYEERSITLVPSEAYTIDAYGDNLPSNALIFYEDIELIPYVIKWQPGAWGNPDAWHVDVAAVRNDSLIVSYNLNLAGYTVTEGSVYLPDTDVYVENKDDGNYTLSYTIPTDEDWVVNDKTVTVSYDETQPLVFQGWSLTPTPATSAEIYAPGETITIEASPDTITYATLYAIWDIPWEIETGDITVTKTVRLASGSPYGASIPSSGESNYSRFTYTINFTFDPNATDSDTTAMKNIRFEAFVNSISYTALFSEIINDPTAYENIIRFVSDGAGIIQHVEFYLGDGEHIKFFDIPADANNDDVEDVYVVTETIPDAAREKYSTDTSSKIYETSQNVAIPTTGVTTDLQFYNYYSAPVAGLKIKVVGGDENEHFMFRITDSAATVDIVVAVPANGTVNIVNLLTKTYTITPINTTWNNLWTAPTEQDQAVSEGGDVEVEFVYTRKSDGKWLFGHGLGSS